MSAADFYRAKAWIEEVSMGRQVIWPVVKEWLVGAEFDHAIDALAFLVGSSDVWTVLDDRTMVLGETEWGNFDPDTAMEEACTLVEQINANDRCKIKLGVEAAFGFRTQVEAAEFDQSFLSR